MRRLRGFLALVVVGLVWSLLVAPVAVQATRPRKPTRVIIIVLDQTRRDTITRYDMDAVKGLIRNGVNFPNAYLGHMAAETVITHNVVTSGQLPKHMGWTNEVYRDVGNITGLGEGSYQVTSSMSCSQFRSLVDARGYLKLQDYLDSKFGESSTFASIAEKRSAACPAGATDGAIDPQQFALQIRGSSVADPACPTLSRKPEDPYVNAPAYLGLAANCNRYWTQQTDTYGTDTIPPGWMYPLEGNRFLPGFDSANIGGDAWSADVAIDVIENDPNWRGMMVSLGAIDKAGHMWGPNDQGEPGALPGSIEEMRRLPFLAKNADVQVGQILDALEAAGELDETLIVVTADHGSQTGRKFFGVNEAGRSNFNWYYGLETTPASDLPEDYRDASPAIQTLVDALGSNLGFSYQDSHIAAWLNDASHAKKDEAVAAVRKLPRVVAAYHRSGDRYVRHGPVGFMPKPERRWFNLRAQELLNTMAAANGPDVVGLLRNNTTYGVIGDHGGHQQQVQNIPIVFSWPGLADGAKPRLALRSVDILPTILRTMGIAFDPSSMDGKAVWLPRA